MRPLATLAGLFVIALGLTFLPARHPTIDAERGSAPPKARVGLVFDVGGRGDKSFNDSAFLGLERAAKELGVEVGFLEPVSGEDREAALRLFAARGMDLVIGVGVIFRTDVDAVARDYPAVHFACVDYFPSKEGMPPNVEGLAFREEEGAFLVGAVAGLLTKSKHVGFVGGMTLPLIRKFEAGYRQGVGEVCRECQVHAGYAGATPDAFHDPAKGKMLAIAQIGAGADILFHASGSTGHGVFEGAKERGALAIGVDADQYDEMPGTVVTSLVKHVDVAVYEAIRAVAEHRFVGGMHVFGLREGGVDYVHQGPHAAGIPQDVRLRVEGMRARIIRGELHVGVEAPQ